MAQAQTRAVWITRAAPGALATAERVASLGLIPIIAPLLAFKPLSAKLTLASGEALAFTSINGVTRAAALMRERTAPVFAVGDATAEAARTAGFSTVVSAGGDVAALKDLILAARPAGGVLHPAARETAGDLVGQLTLAGVNARKAAVYETLTAKALPTAVTDAVRDKRLFAVLIHSPKAGRAAAALLRDQSADLGAVAAFGLSAACVAPLDDLGFKALKAAGAPTEEALAACLSAGGSHAE